MSDLKNIERCVLCLDEKRSPVRIQCGHSFCNECLTVYKSYQKYAWANKCPICRGILKDKKRTSKMNTTNSSGNNQNRHGTATTTGVLSATNSMAAAEQTCILEEFIAIATDEDHTPTAREFEDDMEVEGNGEDESESDENQYISDSDDELYYYFQEDEDSSDQQTSIVDVEDYEAEVVANSDFTILTNEGGSCSRISASRPDIGQTTDSDVVCLDDIIIVVD